MSCLQLPLVAEDGKKAALLQFCAQRIGMEIGGVYDRVFNGVYKFTIRFITKLGL